MIHRTASIALLSCSLFGLAGQSSIAADERLGIAHSVSTNAAKPAPFYRLRDATLSYNGPEVNLTNLAAIGIGWFGPHDNTNGWTADMWWAANLAIREANEKSRGQGLPFKLIPRWAADSWGTGISQLTRMVYGEQPLAILGAVDSPSTHLAEQVVAKAQLPLISPVTTDKSVTLAGVSWMFSCAPSDDALATCLVDAVFASLQAPGGRWVLLTATDHESRMTTREVLREFSRRGRAPDFHLQFRSGANELTSHTTALTNSRPASVVIIAGAEDAARLVSLVRANTPKAAIFGSHAMGRARFLELAGRAAEDIRFPLLITPNPADTDYVRFEQRFRAEQRHEPDFTAVLAYDATRLLIEAIHRAGPNRARLRETLFQMCPWRGLGGQICFNGTGQNTRTNVIMGTVRSGRVIPLESETRPAHVGAAPGRNRIFPE